MKPIYKTIVILTVFSIAMGFLETAVVVYLRTIYYPTGFRFPLAPLDPHILNIELIREAATLTMLLSIAIIAGKGFTQKFSFFLYSFAIWDIFYYIFLKLLIGWPYTLLTWDILFLLPVPWVGPVLAPCLLSLTMILLMIIGIYFHQKNYTMLFSRLDWFLMILASFIIITSFTIDYICIILNSSNLLSPETMTSRLRNYEPEDFNWFIFGSGWAILLADFTLLYFRNQKVTRLPKNNTHEPPE